MSGRWVRRCLIHPLPNVRCHLCHVYDRVEEPS